MGKRMMSNNEERIIDLVELLRHKTNFIFAMKVSDCISELENKTETILRGHIMPDINDGYWFDYIKQQQKELQQFSFERREGFLPLEKAYAIAIIRYVREVRN